jgi:RNA polymerase sigma factor (TIGR02999 family)
MTDPAAAADVTRLLHAGDAAGLLAVVYTQLRAIAARAMRSERTGHTLQATALVHEAYLKLVGPGDLPWASRVHFYGAAAEAMRRILIDHARARGAGKRGGEARRVEFSGVLDLAAADDPRRVLSFDRAFVRLEQEDAQAAAVVRLRFYAGLSVQETALALGVSDRTVDRAWSYARAWLWRELSQEPENDGVQHEGPGDL